MHYKIIFATLAVLIGNEFVSAQQIPSTTTAGELWNPWTWFWPYAIASSEAYRDYYSKAQKATNELYQQIYKTNAFPWVTGNWGPQVNPSGVTGGLNNSTGGSAQNNATGGSGGQSNTTGGSGGSGTSDQNNTTGGTGGSGTSDPSGGSGGSGTSDPSGGSGQTDSTGGSGSSGQSDSTTGSGGSADAQVQGSV